MGRVYDTLTTALTTASAAAIHLVQALVHRLGLNTGGATQVKQKAEIIMSKLCRLAVENKKVTFWAELVRDLPSGAQRTCTRLRSVLACVAAAATARTTGGGVSLTQTQNTMALLQVEADMCRHVVLTEVVAWYDQDGTRMRDYDQFVRTRVVPRLPLCLQKAG